MTGAVQGLIDRLAQAGPAVIDGDTAPAQAIPDSAPCLIVYGATATPAHRHLDGGASAATTAARVLCSSNNPAGARWLAGQTTALLDGWLQDGACWRVGYVSEPVEDRDDPSSYRWSSTVEATRPATPVRSTQQ